MLVVPPLKEHNLKVSMRENVHSPRHIHRADCIVCVHDAITSIDALVISIDNLTNKLVCVCTVRVWCRCTIIYRSVLPLETTSTVHSSIFQNTSLIHCQYYTSLICFVIFIDEAGGNVGDWTSVPSTSNASLGVSRATRGDRLESSVDRTDRY